MKNRTILITNDDGIESPGLQAAAQAVMHLGTVTIAAPRYQQTGTGRGLSGDKEATLEAVDYKIKGRPIQAYHGNGTPALIVRHSLRTLFKDAKPDILISGINYGENLGFNITCSGTVGAALEAASFGIPSIAASLQTDVKYHHSYAEMDWSAAEHFLCKFTQSLLRKSLPTDVDVLKIDVPATATPTTNWKITRLARSFYYTRTLNNPGLHSTFGDGTTTITIDRDNLHPNSDIHTIAIDKEVSVTPLSLDLTSQIDFSSLTDEIAD